MRLRKAIDLFSGSGGLTLGLKQAGFRVVGAIEVDRLSVETYKWNHPEVRIWPVDIRSLKAAALRRALHLQEGELDLVAGCPPCQGFSSMTTLNGKRRTRDPRNDLVFEFVRLHSLGEVRSAKVAALIRMVPKNGGSRFDLGTERQLACHRKCDGFKDVYGRMAWYKARSKPHNSTSSRRLMIGWA